MYSSVSKDNFRQQAVSALFDGELSSQETQLIQEAIQADGQLKHFHQTIQSIHTQIQQSVPDESVVRQSQDSVLQHVQRTIRVRPVETPWWQQTFNVPVPLMAAATVVFVLSLGLLVARQSISEAPEVRSASANLSELGVSDRNVNVQVHVDSANTEKLLQWLNSQVDSQQVTIQLPDQAFFQLQGEPVMVRPEIIPEPLRIIPMEDYEE